MKSKRPPLLRRLGLDRHGLRRLVDNYNANNAGHLKHTDKCKATNRSPPPGQVRPFECRCDFFERVRALLRPRREDLPDRFLAFLDDDGASYCTDCTTTAHLEKGEREASAAAPGCSATVALETDDWYPGGECAECGDVIHFSRGR